MLHHISGFLILLLNLKNLIKKGDFIKKWVPEISSAKNIHDPSTDERNDLGYSNHLVDLKESRKKAIEAFSNFSK